MYRDVWDQKPPAIAFQYGILGQIWPGEAIAPASDLAAAAAVAWLLVVLGRQTFSADVGYAAAAIFLLFGDPYLQRLSGIYVRGQCEPFVALAVTAALALLTRPNRARAHLIAAGVALAWAFWLKYNAGAYALPLAVATWASGRPGNSYRSLVAELAWITAGFAIVGLLVLAYFAANGALTDWRLATIDYNLRYSNETYEALYCSALPDDFSAGTCTDRRHLVPGSHRRHARPAPGALESECPHRAGVAGGGDSIHCRERQPQPPQLFRAGESGVGADGERWPLRRISYPAFVYATRLPRSCSQGRGALEPINRSGVCGCGRFPALSKTFATISATCGVNVDRDTYLRRFRGQKHDALENEQLVRDILATTSPTDRIFVFGFSGGACPGRAAGRARRDSSGAGRCSSSLPPRFRATDRRGCWLISAGTRQPLSLCRMRSGAHANSSWVTQASARGSRLTTESNARRRCFLSGGDNLECTIRGHALARCGCTFGS